MSLKAKAQTARVAPRDAGNRKRVRPKPSKAMTGPTTATLARTAPDTNKESALRDKQAITDAYRRRRRDNRQTRWGSKLYT
jgi:hypothetical protein